MSEKLIVPTNPAAVDTAVRALTRIHHSVPSFGKSVPSRLGTDFPKEGQEWWIRVKARTAVSTAAGFVGTINFSDITEDVKKIRCPMLVLTTAESGLASVDQTRAWQAQVPQSELVVLP